MKAPARAVVSDFGGVLTNPLADAFAAYGDSTGVSLESMGLAMAAASSARASHPLYDLEKGLIAESEFLELLEAELPPGTRLDEFRTIWFEALHPNARLIDYLRSLRERGVRTGLLTNNVREWEPLWRAKLPEIDEVFEVIVDSAFVGMRKPERGIYELLLERLGGGLRFEDCVFLDDLEPNVKAAAELGMRAILFEETGAAIEAIEAELA